MKLEKQRELVKACREVRIINQINGDRGQVCRGNILMETKSSGMKMNSEEVSFSLISEMVNSGNGSFLCQSEFFKAL